MKSCTDLVIQVLKGVPRSTGGRQNDALCLVAGLYKKEDEEDDDCAGGSDDDLFGEEEE
jgi:hypothetical protein